ncbi:MAG: pilus assembly protein PilM [Phycisphaeraceae bacterium]
MPGASGRRARGLIGVDLGARSVRMLQLTAGGARLLAAAQRTLPGDRPLQGEAYHQAVGEAIRSMREQGGFRGRRVVSTLPASVVHFKNLRLPRMPPTELAQAVEWEAAERLQLADGQVEVQYFDAGEVRQGDELREEVILMAAPIAFTEAHVQTLVDCGFHPVALDVTPAVLARCLDMETDRHDLAAPARVIVDIGYSASKVLIVRHGRVLFFKLIDVGGQKLDQMVADQLNMSPSEAAAARRQHGAPPTDAVDGASASGAQRSEEVQRVVYEAVRPAIAELAREVSLCLRYYSVTFRGERPESVWLVGGEAHHAALRALLADDVDVTVTPLDPLASVEVGALEPVLSGAGGRCAWAAAVGTARRPRAVTSAGKRRAA